jgi:hypothetical protein
MLAKPAIGIPFLDWHQPPRLRTRRFVNPRIWRRVELLAGSSLADLQCVIASSRKLTETNGLLKHEGEEFSYVLEGALEFDTGTRAGRRLPSLMAKRHHCSN